MTAPAPAFRSLLRRLYLVRFAFALVWAGAIAVAPSAGLPLTTLLVLYPLADAVAVLWQLRAEGPSQASRVPEWANVAVSVLTAIVLGWVSTVSVAGVLAVWGVWAITAGLGQLITAVLRRRVGGQVPLIVSGAISVLAGGAFLAQSAGDVTSAAVVGGYAVVGGAFFLIAAIRLTITLRRERVSR